MRNVGIAILVIGLLLLILPHWLIVLLGVVGAIAGLLTILFPEQANNFVKKLTHKAEPKE